MSLAAIFFDLDSTLIHAQEDPRPSEVAPKTYGPYQVWLRPCATELLAIARATGRPTLLCTSSERRYAKGIADLFGLGFADEQILGLEHLLAGESNLEPGAVLIDDLPPADEIASFKRFVLGIGPDRQFQVPPFQATEFAPEPELVAGFRDFLKRFCPLAGATPAKAARRLPSAPARVDRAADRGRG